ncbi:uncharacterized protein LOC134177179 [Corticium candelabrum]|uniref:uncharacterized protein LOC134177179 n=1 Tax=Corticium candelabrum TaxID=121492 RepID=UPI002E2644B1|nr:uncharacterized protein LOC134177179 [Corticium candelabrum]
MGRRNRRLSSLFHFTSFLVRVSQPYASLISASLISASLISCVQGRDADKAPLAVVCKRPNCNTDSVKVTADETVPFSCVTAATGSPVTDAQWTVHAGDNEELLDKGKCPAGPFQSCSIIDQMLTIHNHTAFLSPTDNFYTIRCCTLATNDTSAEFTVHVGFARLLTSLTQSPITPQVTYVESGSDPSPPKEHTENSTYSPLPEERETPSASETAASKQTATTAVKGVNGKRGTDGSTPHNSSEWSAEIIAVVVVVPVAGIAMIIITIVALRKWTKRSAKVQQTLATMTDQIDKRIDQDDKMFDQGNKLIANTVYTNQRLDELIGMKSDDFEQHVVTQARVDNSLASK